MELGDVGEIGRDGQSSPKKLVLEVVQDWGIFLFFFGCGSKVGCSREGKGSFRE